MSPAPSIDVAGATEQTYLDYLDGKQNEAIGAMTAKFGHALDIQFRHSSAANGLSVGLTREEASLVSATTSPTTEASDVSTTEPPRSGGQPQSLVPFLCENPVPPASGGRSDT